jgi:signal recognition particle receptor subunit beta
MPLIDRRSDTVVLRIVYDGPPEAGKTTNVQELCGRISLNRRGQLRSPGNQERTQFFDWLEMSGGYVQGRRIRCQLVSVPGQPELLRRRRYLLESADAVVFVADSRRASLELNQKLMRELEEILALVGQGRPAQRVLQANKQDLAGALEPSLLAQALGLGPDVTVLGAQAKDGLGVLETLTVAVRFAVERVRSLVLAGEALGDDPCADADQLLAALTEIDKSAVAIAGTSAQGEPQPAAELSRGTAVTSAVVSDVGAPRADVPSGWVWPPVAGRATLKQIEASEIERRAAPWARAGDITLRTGSLWLDTATDWVFRDSDRARHALLAQVERHLAARGLLPQGRVLTLSQDDGEAFRLWALTPRLATLDEGLAEIAGQGARALAAALVSCARIMLSVRALGDTATGRAERGVSGLCLEQGRWVYAGSLEGRMGSTETLVTELSEGARNAAGDHELREDLTLELSAARGGLEAELSRIIDKLVERLGATLTRAVSVLPAPRAAAEVRVTLAPSSPSDRPPIVPAVDVPSGLVWPPVVGRATLAAFAQGRVARAEQAVRWAPPNALELRCDDALVAHTTPAWCFDDIDRARLSLSEAARLQKRLSDFTPRGRTYAIAASEGRAWLWVITPQLASVRDAGRHALALDASAIVELVRALCELARGDPCAHPLSSLDRLAFQEGRVVCLDVPFGMTARGDEPWLSHISQEIVALIARDDGRVDAVREGLRALRRPGGGGGEPLLDALEGAWS